MPTGVALTGPARVLRGGERSLPRGPLPLTINSTDHRMPRAGEKACPLVEVFVVVSAAGACVQGSREMSDGRWLETREHKFVGLIRFLSI